MRFCSVKQGNQLTPQAFAPAFTKASVDGLVLIATNADMLGSVESEVKEINPNIRVLIIAADITKKDSVEKAFEKIKDTFGHVDVLINNAGVNLEGQGALVADEEPDDWWKSFEVNTKGTFLISREFLRQIHPGTTNATIITLVTLAAWKTFPQLSGYGISKAGALQLSQHIAAGYPNVTAVCIHPGLVDTDMLMVRKILSETVQDLGFRYHVSCSQSQKPQDNDNRNILKLF